MEYLLETARASETEDVFALYADRIQWMNENGIRQWNMTDYLQAYPKSYYQRQQREGRLYVLKQNGRIAGAAVLIGWFVHMMALQTSWKNDRLRLAGYFSEAEHYGATISCGETTIEANEQILDYYYTFLTFPRSMAVRRAADAELSDAIVLKLPKTTLYLTEAPDGVSTCVLWTEDGKTHAYQIGGSISYSHLRTYFQNAVSYAERAQAQADA